MLDVSDNWFFDAIVNGSNQKCLLDHESLFVCAIFIFLFDYFIKTFFSKSIPLLSFFRQWDAYKDVANWGLIFIPFLLLYVYFNSRYYGCSIMFCLANKTAVWTRRRKNRDWNKMNEKYYRRHINPVVSYIGECVY